VSTQLALRGTTLAAHSYTPLGEHSPLSVQFDTSPERQFGVGVQENRKAGLFVHLPLVVAGISAGTTFSRNGQRISLTGADGYNWHSPWLVDGGFFAPGLTGPSKAFAEFSIPPSVYDRLGDGLVTARVDFALGQLQDQSPLQFAVSTEGDVVRGLGFCALDDGYFVMQCRSAFREPAYFAVNTFRKQGPFCKMPAGAPAPVIEPAHGFFGDPPQQTSTSLHISPVVVRRLQLNGAGKTATLCPGLPISFVEKRLQGRIEVSMPATQIRLRDYLGQVRTE
jgi:hypothetical protein